MPKKANQTSFTSETANWGQGWKPGQRGGPGDAGFEPTDKDRRTVAALAAHGCPQIEIATVIGICDRTLRKHFRKELDTSWIVAKGQVAQSLFQQAIAGNVQAQKFYLMCRGEEWRPKIEVSSKDIQAATQVAALYLSGASAPMLAAGEILEAELADDGEE